MSVIWPARWLGQSQIFSFNWIYFFVFPWFIIKNINNIKLIISLLIKHHSHPFRNLALWPAAIFFGKYGSRHFPSCAGLLLSNSVVPAHVNCWGWAVTRAGGHPLEMRTEVRQTTIWRTSVLAIVWSCISDLPLFVLESFRPVFFSFCETYLVL